MQILSLVDYHVVETVIGAAVEDVRSVGANLQVGRLPRGTQLCREFLDDRPDLRPLCHTEGRAMTTAFDCEVLVLVAHVLGEHDVPELLGRV
jgi:hypothetical protein